MTTLRGNERIAVLDHQTNCSMFRIDNKLLTEVEFTKLQALTPEVDWFIIEVRYMNKSEMNEAIKKSQNEK
jgi:predicted ATPase